MRPRHYCRGRGGCAPRGRSRRSWRFNEAPALLPGKSFVHARDADGIKAASMRPRHYCRGRVARGFGDAAAGGAASMRPRHYCRGRGERAARWRCRRPLCFNEAPALLPGKRGLRRGGAGFAQSFNEAPALLPGKRLRARVLDQVSRDASMRPRHYCRGRGRGVALLYARLI